MPNSRSGPDGTPQRAYGHVPTPPELAVRLATPLFAEPAATRSPGRSDGWCVLDPACGTGELLLAALQAARKAGVSTRITLEGLEIDSRRALAARDRLGSAARSDGNVDVNIQCRDALDPSFEWPAGMIVANPPWVSFSGRQAARHPSVSTYRQAWRSMDGWPSLHGAFLERIALHCAARGSAARVLVPASICELERYAATRKAVRTHATLSAPPELLDERAFPGVVEPAALLSLAPMPKGGSLPQDAPWPHSTLEEQPIVTALADHPRLASACFGDIGVHTGNSAAELIERDRPTDWPGLREGRDLIAGADGPPALQAPRLGLRTDLRPSPERRFRVADLSRFQAVPLVLRQTADRPIAALHTHPTYFRNTLLACTPPAELAPEFCLAVLNSATAARWHRARNADARQRTFPQVKVRHLRELPFPIASRGEAIHLHDKIVSDVRQGRWQAALQRVELSYGVPR